MCCMGSNSCPICSYNQSYRGYAMKDVIKTLRLDTKEVLIGIIVDVTTLGLLLSFILLLNTLYLKTL